MLDTQSPDEKVQDQVQETPQDTPPEEQETPKKEVQERTYTQSEYSQLQSNLRKQIQELVDDRDAIKLQQELLETDLDEAKAELGVLKSHVDSPYVDDDEKTAAQKMREHQVLIAKKEAELARNQRKFEENVAKENAIRRDNYADKLHTSWPWISLDELLKCKTPEQMDRLVVQTPMPKDWFTKSEKKEETKEEPETKEKTLPRPPGSGSPVAPAKSKDPYDKILSGLQKSKKK